MTAWGMHIACGIPPATNTHSKYVILFVFRCKNGCNNAPRCHVTSTLPALYQLILDRHCGPRPCSFPDVNQPEPDADHSPPSTGAVLLLALYALTVRQGQILISTFTFNNYCWSLKRRQSVNFISGLHIRRPSADKIMSATKL